MHYNPQQATLVIDDVFTVSPVHERLFGSFVEHLGRCAQTLHDDDLFATNTAEHPDRVRPYVHQQYTYDPARRAITLHLPAVAWSAVSIDM